MEFISVLPATAALRWVSSPHHAEGPVDTKVLFFYTDSCLTFDVLDLFLIFKIFKSLIILALKHLVSCRIVE
jgi:hypothetical protein